MWKSTLDVCCEVRSKLTQLTYQHFWKHLNSQNIFGYVFQQNKVCCRSLCLFSVVVLSMSVCVFLNIMKSDITYIPSLYNQELSECPEPGVFQKLNFP